MLVSVGVMTFDLKLTGASPGVQAYSSNRSCELIDEVANDSPGYLENYVASMPLHSRKQCHKFSSQIDELADTVIEAYDLSQNTPPQYRHEEDVGAGRFMSLYLKQLNPFDAAALQMSLTRIAQLAKQDEDFSHARLVYDARDWAAGLDMPPLYRRAA